MTLLAWLNFISPAKDYFSPSETCLIQILAHWMYLSFGATLELIGICTCTVWSVGVPAIINECVLCFSACKMHRLAQAWCLHTFSFFKIWGRIVQPRPSRSGLSNYNYQGSESTPWWPLHSIHCQPACPSIFQAFLSDPDAPEKPRMMKSMPSPGIRRPRPTISIKIIKGQGTDLRGHGGGYDHDQQTPPSVRLLVC